MSRPILRVEDTDRWKLISLVFGLPVLGFGILKVSKPHDHVDPPVEYPYLRMATRVRFLIASFHSC